MLEAFLSYCSTALAGISLAEAMPYTLFFISFFGGFAHCSFMCGPFVLAQQMQRMKSTGVHKMSEFKRLQGVLLLPYHFGRITTYTLLGVVAFYVGGLLPKHSHVMLGVVLMLSGLFILLSAFKISVGRGLGKKLSGGLSRLTKGLSLSPVGFSGYTYGLILGLLPCTMVYGVLTAVASMDQLSAVVLSMIFFGIGTIPALVVVSILSHMGAEMMYHKIKSIGKIGLIVSSLWLIGLGAVQIFF